MQLHINNGLRALALTLAFNLLIFADAQTRTPISYLSGAPNLTISYSWLTNCKSGGNCMSSVLLPGACYNLRSSASSGTPQLLYNFNSFYGMGSPASVGGVVAQSLFTCNVYADECLSLINTYSYDAATVASTTATRAASIRCGNWESDPTMNTDYMLVIGKFRNCNKGGLGGNCLNVYPFLSRCYNFLRPANSIVSVMGDQGMYCTLYSATGCAGNMAAVPMGQKADLFNLKFVGMAKSFMCIGGI